MGYQVIGLVIFLVIIAGVVKFLLPLLAKKEPKTLPYESAGTLFSPAERSFLGVLEQAVGNDFKVMGKVRLADIINIKKGLSGSERQQAFNRIQSKHVDFVVCDTKSLTLQCVVELDDSSHQQAQRQERDAFVDKVMSAAGIHILHFSAKKSYSIQEVRDAIAGAK
ncbi:MAG: hypothetical protein A2283_03710 [Lentisphaerae bacterium RIFOXYA12_FULL_48_11]|nr:MAG: hypothetical protein A2283_03710 [Lentisphaerae bacterium RIFOXYA12_FULL_48_11]